MTKKLDTVECYRLEPSCSIACTERNGEKDQKGEPIGSLLLSFDL